MDSSSLPSLMWDTAMPTPVAWSRQAARTRALGSFAAALPALARLAALAEALPLAYACCAFACRGFNHSQTLSGITQPSGPLFRKLTHSVQTSAP